MTIPLVACAFFSGNLEASRSFLDEYGYIPKAISKSRFNRRLHAIDPSLWRTLFDVLAEVFKHKHSEQTTYVVDSLAVGVCDNIRIRRCKHEEVEAQKVRLLSEGFYQAESWEKERRVIYKAEVMAEGQNTRFVVTSKRTADPKKLYDWYVERGESENWIKDFKLAIKADRLSCHRFMANQFRLLLHAAVYWLLDTLRRRLVMAGVRRMQLDTLRLSLIKIAGRVRQLLTKVRLHLASGHPGRRLWDVLAPPSVAVS